ncbi:MAG: hypothetical protein HY661_05935 [Betaproteobacteria bacterium]|nr:hypothetical protein [Betaproteobacteria bacterium]
MVKDFSEILSPEEILRTLMDLAKPFPGVREIRLLCQERAQDSIVCVIDASQYSWALADAIGGFLYGGKPARTIAPLAAEFRCAGRHEGKLKSAFCAKCSASNANTAGAGEAGQNNS